MSDELKADAVMNYETATDFELNFKLARLLDLRPKRGRDDTVRLCGIKIVDYCNNWNDIMPIAVELNITLDPRGLNKKLGAMASFGKTYAINHSPQRALVICCINVLESKGK